MCDESEIKGLQRQIAEAESRVRKTVMKVEDLEVSVEEFYRFKDRLVMFPRHTEGKRPVRVDKSESVGDFGLT